MQRNKKNATEKVAFFLSLSGIENYGIIIKYDSAPLKRRDIIIKIKNNHKSKATGSKKSIN